MSRISWVHYNTEVLLLLAMLKLNQGIWES